jgi:hypothetical protein
MSPTTTVEVWVLVDDCGDYVVATDPDRLGEEYEADVQDLANAGGLRRVKVTLTVPLPEPVELTGVVADDGPATLTAARTG